MSIFFAHPVVDLNPSTSKIFSCYSTEEFCNAGVKGFLGGCLGYAYYWIKSNAQKGLVVSSAFFGFIDHVML
jgi:hypothetical protein